MARRREGSRVTAPGTRAEPEFKPTSELPPIRHRKPVLFWTIIVAVAAMVLPLVAGLIQVLL